MLTVQVADSLAALASRLSSVLAHPPPDPLATEWVAVPSSGIQRWLELRLANDLGSSGTDRDDGISANIDFARPGTLRRLILGGDGVTDDPWDVSRLVWTILAVTAGGTDTVGIPALAPHASRYAWARRVADRFDRYHVHRPAMVRDWAAGHDRDASGRTLAKSQVWQPRLWRAARAAIAQPSPPEQLPDRVAALRAGELVLDLPARIAVFGLSSLPGGSGFIEILEALAVVRDVSVYLLDPSPGTTAVFGRAFTGTSRFRNDDGWRHATESVAHPLVRTWGRLTRETPVMLVDANVATELVDSDVVDSEDAADPATMLDALRADVIAGRAPSGMRSPNGFDRSVQFHSCHGESRQVEVLRDAILHLLADDATLREDDVLVVCPRLARFVPIVRAVFGPSATDAIGSEPAGQAPTMRYVIADRSLQAPNSVAQAFETLLELLASPFGVVSVLEFCALGPVRARFGFDDEALTALRGWAHSLNVRWGLDGDRRSRFGIPATLEANTWRAAADRLLLGSAVADDDAAFTIGGVIPEGVEGASVAIVGVFADLLERLGRFADACIEARPMRAWTDLFRDACATLFSVDAQHDWEPENVRRTLAGIDDAVASQPDVEATFADVRRLVSEQLHAGSGRAGFFRGGITITSMESLRWVPFRVVCILGLDDGALSAPAPDGADLLRVEPRFGDVDRRGEARQVLLETVLAAQSHLVITRNGADVSTNAEVPEAVAVAELRETLLAMVTPEMRDAFAARLQIVHPRHAFDERCFVPGALGAVASSTAQPWAFDPVALGGARARQRRETVATPFMTTPFDLAPLEEIEIGELRGFLKNPTQTFLQRTLELRLPEEPIDLVQHLPVALGGLDGWNVRRQLLDADLAGIDVETARAREVARSAVPIGSLGTTTLDQYGQEVTDIADSVRTRLGGEPITRVDIDVSLSTGVRIVGSVDAVVSGPIPGVVRYSVSSMRDVDQLATWLDLMLLMVTEPSMPWLATVIGRKAKPKKGESSADVATFGVSPELMAETGPDSVLCGIVDLFERARREAIPLFPSLSRRVSAGSATPADWKAFNGFGGAGDDRFVSFVYGDIEFADLERIPARPDDPAGHGARLARYAHALWGAFDQSVTLLDLVEEQP